MQKWYLGMGVTIQELWVTKETEKSVFSGTLRYPKDSEHSVVRKTREEAKAALIEIWQRRIERIRQDLEASEGFLEQVTKL